MTSGARTLQDVERSLNNWLKPQVLGESWDNIGLLVGSGKYEKNEKEINRILLCNDLMPAVLEEAVGKEVDMILSYHPPIFTGMKSISYGSWKVTLPKIVLTLKELSHNEQKYSCLCRNAW